MQQATRPAAPVGTWRLFGVLMLGALVATLGAIPYALTLAGEPPSGYPLPLWLLLTIQTAQSLVLMAIFVAVGLHLGRKVGLGPMLLRDWLAGDPTAGERFRGMLLPATVLGISAALAIILLDVYLFAPQLSITPSAMNAVRPPPWQGFLVSFYGGIGEELLLRLGLMTFLVWAGTRLARRKSPPAALIWLAIILSTILFGVGHLPATALIMPLTPIVIARALVLNGLAGVILGWLYWRRDLLAAIVAHFSADIILHVVFPAIQR